MKYNLSSDFIQNYKLYFMFFTFNKLSGKGDTTDHNDPLPL